MACHRRRTGGRNQRIQGRAGHDQARAARDGQQRYLLLRRYGDARVQPRGRKRLSYVRRGNEQYGYLLQRLRRSPRKSHRDDDYGGRTGNRNSDSELPARLSDGHGRCRQHGRGQELGFRARRCGQSRRQQDSRRGISRRKGR